MNWSAVWMNPAHEIGEDHEGDQRHRQGDAQLEQRQRAFLAAFILDQEEDAAEQGGKNREQQGDHDDFGEHGFAVRFAGGQRS